MSMFGDLLGQAVENVDVQGLAAKVGLTPEETQLAIHALSLAHPQPGDTAALAAQHTGLPEGALNQIIEHIGGEGSLGRFAGIIEEANQSGALGQIEGQLAGLAQGFFKK